MRKTTSLLLAIIFAVTVALAVINTSMASNSSKKNMYATITGHIPLPPKGWDDKP